MKFTYKFRSTIQLISIDCFIFAFCCPISQALRGFNDTNHLLWTARTHCTSSRMVRKQLPSFCRRAAHFAKMLMQLYQTLPAYSPGISMHTERTFLFPVCTISASLPPLLWVHFSISIFMKILEFLLMYTLLWKSDKKLNRDSQKFSPVFQFWSLFLEKVLRAHGACAVHTKFSINGVFLLKKKQWSITFREANNQP